MKFSTVSLTAVLAVMPTALAAPNVVITNTCTFTAYVKRLSGQVDAIKPNGAISISQAQPGTLQLGVTPQLSAPLIFQFENSGSTQLFYELHNDEGNPFYQFRNVLTPSRPQCHTYDCPPQGAPTGGTCYGNHVNQKGYNCNTPVDFTLALCYH